MVYKPYKLNLTKAQQTKAAAGKSIRLKRDQLDSGNYIILLHPSNYKLIVDAVRKNKGLTLPGLSPGEIKATIDSDMDGSGVFDWLKKGFNWVKNNWGVIKPVVSAVGDAVAATVPGAAAPRAAVRQLTGVGITGKRGRPRGANGLYISNRGNGLYL